MKIWKEKFIEPELDICTEEEQPASYIRKVFVIEKPVKQAQLEITALGVYKGYLNGKELDEQMLLPGYTDYKYRVQYQKYIVTDRLRRGENVLAAAVGDGWYRGCLGIGSKRNNYGTKLQFFCHLAIMYEDGTKEEIYSDESFRAAQTGPIRENNIKTIERYDARKELEGWNRPGYDDSRWHGVKKSAYHGNLKEAHGEKILPHERFTPQVLHTPDGSTVLDFGQNMAGYVQFTVSGKAGHTVCLTMGEVLDKNGNFTMENLAAEGASLISGEVGQRLEYILKDGRQVYRPFSLISGFRYVRLENWPEEVRGENFQARAVYSDLPFVGDFSCSNECINQLVKNVRWSQKSNFVDIPTDCPTRERSGWTADISVFGETACYLSDTRKFLKKWLVDYQLEQGKDGNLPYVVPEGGKPGRQRGCMGWSNAVSNLAWILYRFYGEKQILEEVYDTVKRFVEFNIKRASETNPFFLFKRGKHRKYIIETGFHYGEWLEPGTAMYKDFFKDLLFPDTEVTTAWFYETVKQLADMAELLDKKEDWKKYHNLQKEIQEAYQKEFLKKGTVRSKRQCRYVRPIAMGLLTDKQKEEALIRLNEMCVQNQYRIGTGFLTTYQILSVLADGGYVETAYRMLENTKQPGWLFAVTKGATTTWENWYGITEDGSPVDSHNHYAPGAVVAWLFSRCAGIVPIEPGFRSIRIRPLPGGSLTFARAKYQSVRGEILSSWEKDEKEFHLHVEIPEKVKAEIILPNGEEKHVIGGIHDFICLHKQRGDERNAAC